jgi:thiol-disulfide isomerase/thioredoxin
MRLYSIAIMFVLALGLALMAGADRTDVFGRKQPDTSSRSSSTKDKYAFDLTELGSDQTMNKPAMTADKPLVLFVWAPDCPACMRHMPYAVALYKKLDLENENFTSIAMSGDESDVASVVEDKHLNFPVLLSDSGHVGAGFELDGWPTTYVFRKGGQLESMIESTGAEYFTEVLDAVAAAQKR